MIENVLASGMGDFLSAWYGILIFVLIDVAAGVAIVALLYKYFFKYLFDFLIGLVGSVVTSPVALVIMILSKRHIIKTNEYTSVLTVTYAAGKNGKKIPLHSFTAAASLTGELTKLGAFLRKTGLENLPRIYDLLLLRLSVVGVKPLSPVDEQFVSEEDYERFSVRPGIVNPLYIYVKDGEGETTYEDMFFSDKTYVAKEGLFTDIAVLFSALLGRIRGDKKNVFGETSRKEYSEILLERGEISLSDYEEALQDPDEDEENQPVYDGTEDD